MEVPEAADGHVTYDTMFDAIRVVPGSDEKIGALKMLLAVVRFIIKRWQVSGVIDQPTFAGIEHHKELTQPFAGWLADQKLETLSRLFQLPVTMMGFGSLHETPSIYALKFMTLRTFTWMTLKEVPIIGRFVGWPKRFVLGYQRLFERIAWDLDVRLNADIQEIERADDGVRITFTQPVQDLSETRPGETQTIEVDSVILACPLVEEVTGRILAERSPEETSLFGQIKRVSYCNTAMHVDGLKIGEGVGNAGPLAAIYPVPDITRQPVVNYGVAQQWPGNNFVQFYSRTQSVDPSEPVQDLVFASIRELIEKMGGSIDDVHAPSHFRRWLYFQHVDTDSLNDGWYSKLEDLQGQQNTYYVGGATNLELIEPIALYAKHLVSRHFPG